MGNDLEFFLNALAQTPTLRRHLEERITGIRRMRKFLLMFLVLIFGCFLYVPVIPEMIYLLSALLVLLIGLWLRVLFSVGDLGWRVYISGVAMGVFRKDDLILSTLVTSRLVGFGQKTVIIAMKIAPIPKIKRR